MSNFNWFGWIIHNCNKVVIAKNDALNYKQTTNKLSSSLINLPFIPTFVFPLLRDSKKKYE